MGTSFSTARSVDPPPPDTNMNLRFRSNTPTQKEDDCVDGNQAYPSAQSSKKALTKTAAEQSSGTNGSSSTRRRRRKHREIGGSSSAVVPIAQEGSEQTIEDEALLPSPGLLGADLVAKSHLFSAVSQGDKTVDTTTKSEKVEELLLAEDTSTKPFPTESTTPGNVRISSAFTAENDPTILAVATTPGGSRDASPTASLVRFGNSLLNERKRSVQSSDDRSQHLKSESAFETPNLEFIGKEGKTLGDATESEADFHLSSGAATEGDVMVSLGLNDIAEPFEPFSPGRQPSRHRRSSDAVLMGHTDGSRKPSESHNRNPGNRTRPRSTTQYETSSTATSKPKGKAGSGIHFSKSSQLQRWPPGVSPCVLYAREPDASNCSSANDAIPTQLAKIALEDDQRDLVFGDATFEVQVVGLHVAEDDDFPLSGLAKLGLASSSSTHQKHRVLYSSRKDPSDGVNTIIPAVHYDSIRRESQNRLNRDYVHVPPDKGLVTRGRGGPREVLSVAMQFVLFQIQGEIPRNTVRSTLDNVDALNETLNSLSSSDAPYFSLLAPFIRVSGGLGNAALEQAGCTNRTIDANVSFRLVSRDPTLNPHGEAWLRKTHYPHTPRAF